MFGFLENLRQQPIKERKKVTWIVSGSLTLIIFAFWLVYLSQPTDDAYVSQTATKSSRDLDKSFSLISDNLGRLFETTKEQISSVKGFFSNLSTSTTYEKTNGGGVTK